jgi:hypothetical protein
VNSDRSQAYTRVVAQLRELSGTKLHAGEEQLVREAADELLFCDDFDADAKAHAVLARVYELADELTSSERLTAERAQALVADVEACGPFEPDARAA